MRGTDLYTDEDYPISGEGEGRIMHAWDGCPAAQGELSWGSIRQMEQEGFETCPVCGFAASSLGRVASASSSIDNGFEYHYAIVAQAAEDHERARGEVSPAAQALKDKVAPLLEKCGELLSQAAGFRIDAAPPGRFGTVVLVANLGQVPSSLGFENGFVEDSGSLGARVALSAAMLVPDKADDQGNVISSILNGLKGGVLGGAADIVVDLWGGLLSVYSKGQEALDGALQDVIGALPFASASGLGTWASKFFQEAVAKVGLQPVDLDALKPVLVNSAHVAAKDASGVGARLLSLKREAQANPFMSADPLSSLAGSVESSVTGGISAAADGIEIATIELFEGGPSFTIRVALPSTIAEGAERFVKDAADALRRLGSNITGVRIWE